MGRRTYLTAAGAVTTAFLTGCLGGFRTSDDSSGPEENSETDESNGNTETNPKNVIDAYLTAIGDGDVDAVAEIAHSSSPLNPEQYDDTEFEYDSDEVGEPDAFDAEILVLDASVEDVVDVGDASALFDESELEDDIGDEDIRLVDADTDYRESGSDSEIWVLVTEDDAWRVFWVGVEDDAPDDPEEAFEDPIIDEDGDVVAEIDWEFDQDGGGQASDVEWAQVVFTDSPGVEADAVRVESTIAEWELELSGDEPNGWAGSWANVGLHPDGDQVVVTIIENGSEEVVHREHYEP